MNLISALLTIVGLSVFEIVSSIDNAVVNADVLGAMSPKYRRWFLVWGIFIGVILVRGLLPWLIVWLANPQIGLLGSLSAAFSSDPNVAHSIEKSGPILLIGGGIFLIFLFLHWLFIETKNYGLRFEPFFNRNAVWFFAIASVFLAGVIWFSLNLNPLMAFSAAIGSSAFFIVYGFREQSAKAELELKKGKNLSDLSKLIYLEILDATFSIDGVIGAFAFTFSVPLIILGNGLGALIVRQLTIKGVDSIKKYLFLKNGAMYSIFFLGIVMVMESFGLELPSFISPLITLATIGYFYLKSRRALRF